MLINLGLGELSSGRSESLRARSALDERSPSPSTSCPMPIAFSTTFSPLHLHSFVFIFKINLSLPLPLFDFDPDEAAGAFHCNLTKIFHCTKVARLNSGQEED